MISLSAILIPKQFFPEPAAFETIRRRRRPTKSREFKPIHKKFTNDRCPRGLKSINSTGRVPMLSGVEILSDAMAWSLCPV
jgi:hypothetical protein